MHLRGSPEHLAGCYTGDANDQAFGARTYWTGADEGEDRGFDQSFLDRLPLNCVPYPLMAAFCAWDGGRLETWEENSAAYGPRSYPWGETPEAGGFGERDGNPFTEKGPARFSSSSPPPPAAAVRWGRSGSWEGHQANYTGWQFPPMTKYGKTGGRCARD
jgi:hypothetical protein